MYIKEFNKNTPELIFTFSTMFESGNFIALEPFERHGISTGRHILLAHSGDSYDRYEVSFKSWPEIFNALVVYLTECVFKREDEFVSYAKEAVFAYEKLSDDEKKNCAGFRGKLFDCMLRKMDKLQFINNELSIVASIVDLQNKSEFIVKPEATHNFEDMLRVNDELARKNTSYYKALTAAGRDACRAYNSVAPRASAVLNQEFKQQKKHIAPEEYFPNLYADIDTDIWTISETDVHKLEEKVTSVWTELDECMRLLSRAEVETFSELDNLCHQFNSFPSPLIWAIYDKQLSEDNRLAVVTRLALQKPINSNKNVKNINIACGKPDTDIVNVRSPLIHAVEIASPAIVAAIIQAGVNVNEYHKNGLRKGSVHKFNYNYHCDGDKMTALHAAAKRGDIDILRLLLNAGVDVRAVNVEGKSALHLVSNVECARLLLDKGADINAADRHGNTPLHGVSAKLFDIKDDKQDKKSAHLALFLLYVARTSNINQQNKYGYTPLHFAVNTSISDSIDYELIKNKVKLLCDAGANVNIFSFNHDAASDSHDVYHDHPTPAMTPLLCLYDQRNHCKLDKLDITEILISHGADVFAADTAGQTILHKVVALYSNVKVFDYLMAQPFAKELVKYQAVDKETPLHTAVYWGVATSDTHYPKNDYLHFIKKLLEQGADIYAEFKHKNNSSRGVIKEASLTPLDYGRVAIDAHRIKNGENCRELSLLKEWISKQAKIKSHAQVDFSHLSGHSLLSARSSDNSLAGYDQGRQNKL